MLWLGVDENDNVAVTVDESVGDEVEVCVFDDSIVPVELADAEVEGGKVTVPVELADAEEEGEKVTVPVELTDAEAEGEKVTVLDDVVV